ncbi:uncharacterized protein TNCV_4313671 [Trichonephila clavipes]|nr:uncharacterized protein TNCV_4313671 [Trichonephila clavipes]
MPGKRARRLLSQLSEFERDLIIGMKTAGWSTRRVAGQVDRLKCAARNCWEQWTREGTHARKTWSGATRKTTRRVDRRIVRQALVDPTVTRSTVRADVGVAIVPQKISRHLAEQELLKTNYVIFQTLRPARSPDLSPVEPVWDQLKRQMPSCDSAHDLELAVQVLWAHLPQDSIRCLINSMPDRVAACIAAGGGSTR